MEELKLPFLFFPYIRLSFSSSSHPSWLPPSLLFPHAHLIFPPSTSSHLSPTTHDGRWYTLPSLVNASYHLSHSSRWEIHKNWTSTTSGTMKRSNTVSLFSQRVLGRKNSPCIILPHQTISACQDSAQLSGLHSQRNRGSSTYSNWIKIKKKS